MSLNHLVNPNNTNLLNISVGSIGVSQGLQLASGAQNGYILQSNASGFGTWIAPGSLPGFVGATGFTGATGPSATSSTGIITYVDLGMAGDGVTDDSEALVLGLKNLQNPNSNRPLTVYLNSPLGFAFYQVCNLRSNIDLIIDSPVYYYGDATIRFQGGYYLGDEFTTLYPGTSVSEGDTVIPVANVSLFVVGQIVDIVGDRDSSGQSLWNQYSRVTAVDSVSVPPTITFANELEDDYTYQYPSGNYTQIKIALSNKSTQNISAGVFTVTMDGGDVSMYHKGQMVILNDYLLIKNVYTGSTSNNTFHNDVNIIVDVNPGTGVLTFDKALVHSYVSTSPLYVIPTDSCQGSRMKVMTQEYMVYPTSKSKNLFQMNFAQNCTINDTNVTNRVRKETILVSPAIGFDFEVLEGITIRTIQIPQGIYTILDFCDKVKNLLNAASPLVYACTYNRQTGCITLSANQIFTILNDSLTLGYFGFLPFQTYSGSNTYTGNPIFYSGNFRLSSFSATNNTFTFNEGGSNVVLTLPDYWYNISTLLLQLQVMLNQNSPNGWTYTCAIEANDTITISNNTGNFSIVLTGQQTTSIFARIGLHNSSGTILSTLSGAQSYNSATWAPTIIYPICSNRGMGFRFDLSINCAMNNVSVGYSRHSTSGESYGLVVYRSASCTVNTARFYGCRHDILLFEGTNNCNFVNISSTGFKISCIDLHGANEVYNNFSNIVCIAGNEYSPDATTKGFLRCGNTTHMAGSSYNTFANCMIDYGINDDPTTKTNYGFVIYPPSNYNVCDNMIMYGGDTGILAIDVSGKVNPAQYISTGNIIKNCVFNKLLKRMVVLNPNNSGTGSVLTDTLIKNCTFANCGSGSVTDSKFTITSCTNTTVQNCDFTNLAAGSPDDYTIIVSMSGGTRVINNKFQAMARGCYFNTGCGAYYYSDNTFDNLSGSSPVFLRDGGNAATGFGANVPNILNSKFLGTQNFTQQWDGTTSTSLAYSNIRHRNRLYTSNASAATTLSGAITINNTAPTSLANGVTPMGSTTVTYSSQNSYGQLIVTAVVPFQYPASVTASNVILLIYQTISGTSTLIGYALKPCSSAMNSQFETIMAIGKVNFTTKLSSATCSIDIRFGSNNTDIFTICNTFAAKPFFTVEEKDAI